MKKKAFDAVAMVRRIRDAHYEQFKDKPIEERLAYYKEQARAFHEELEQKQKDEDKAA